MTDRAAERRAARRADNRADILDAAERVFAEHGIQAGSIRKIGAASGYSAAAVYTFFDSKQHLLAATLTRRGDELLAAMRGVVAADPAPVDGLHQVVDVTVDLFAVRHDFGRLLHRLRGGPTGDSSSAVSTDPGDLDLLHEATGIITGLIRAGQADGSVRDGTAGTLARLYETLLHEHVLLASTSPDDALTRPQLHALVHGAFAR